MTPSTNSKPSMAQSAIGALCDRAGWNFHPTTEGSHIWQIELPIQDIFQLDAMIDELE